MVDLDLHFRRARAVGIDIGKDVGLIHNLVSFELSADDVSLVELGHQLLKFSINLTKLLGLFFFIKLALHLALHFILHLLALLVKGLLPLPHFFFEQQFFILELLTDYFIFLLALGEHLLALFFQSSFVLIFFGLKLSHLSLDLLLLSFAFLEQLLLHFFEFFRRLFVSHVQLHGLFVRFLYCVFIFKGSVLVNLGVDIDVVDVTTEQDTITWT